MIKYHSIRSSTGKKPRERFSEVNTDLNDALLIMRIVDSDGESWDAENASLGTLWNNPE